MIISRSISLRMRNVSDNIFGENQNIFHVNNFFSENRAVYVKMWQNMVDPDKLQTTTQYGA